VLFAGGHTPLVTTARNHVVTERPVAVYVAEVAPEILFHDELSVDDCHWILPVLPPNEIVELLEVAHTVADVVTVAVPPTEAGLTTTESMLLFTAAQAPLCTTAR
jgi:hypothetical protein